MSNDFFEESASELLSGANSETDPWWRDVLEEMASELVSRSNASLTPHCNRAARGRGTA
jgi:hypothetical protein